MRSNLHTHLESEGPAGDIVRRIGRAAGIAKIVGVILRFEHVEHVRAESLGGLDDVGSGGIGLPGDGEAGGGALDVDAGLQQSIEELDRVGEIGLIGRDDISARIAKFGIVQDLVVKVGRKAATSAESAATACAGNVAGRTGITGRRRGSRCAATTSASASASSSRRLCRRLQAAPQLPEP